MYKDKATSVIAASLLLMIVFPMFPHTAQAKRKTAPLPPIQTIAPALIAGTRSEMNTPGFWIARHPFPDRIILQEDGIRELNEAIRIDLNITHDLSSYPSMIVGKGVLDALAYDISSISDMKLYRSDGSAVDRSILHNIRENMNLGAILPEIEVRFGFIVKSADQRKLPTEICFSFARFNQNFDKLQDSVLDIGTPLAILHTSADRKWHYAAGPFGEGWVEDEKIVFCPFAVMEGYLKNSDFAVVTSAKGDMYLNPALTDHCDRVKMGVRYPLVREHGSAVMEVTIPRKDQNGSCIFVSGYMRKEDVHRGYLPYTPRTVILQAFEFLNDPYGWGDMNGEQDCSSFIRSVFATVGVELPRNSLFQSRSGKLLAAFDKNTPLENRLAIINAQGIGGITLLGMKGHIMLYLGAIDGTPYAIHGIWAYRETVNGREIVKVVSRIVVTDLFLGKDGSYGSLLMRLMTATMVEK